MSPVAIKCAKCAVKLGTVENLWVQVGNGYLAPVPYSDRVLELETSTSGAIWLGESGTIVEGCKLQDITCSSCSALLGSQCLNSTPNNALTEGQYLFLNKSITIKSTVDGRRRIDPKIQHSLQWTVDATMINADEYSSESAEDQSPERAPQHNRQSRGASVGAPLDSQLDFQLDPEVASAFQSVMSYIERELGTVHKFIAAVRAAGEEQQKKQTAILQDELSKAKAELDQLKDGNLELKEQLEQTNQIAREAIDTARGLASELSMLKEDAGRIETALSSRVVPSPANNFQYSRTTGLKRSSLMRDDDRDDKSGTNPSKRVAMTPELTSATQPRHSSIGGSQRSSPIVSSASRRNGLLARPPRRSSGIFGDEKRQSEEPKEIMDR